MNRMNGSLYFYHCITLVDRSIILTASQVAWLQIHFLMLIMGAPVTLASSADQALFPEPYRYISRAIPLSDQISSTPSSGPTFLMQVRRLTGHEPMEIPTGHGMYKWNLEGVGTHAGLRQHIAHLVRCGKLSYNSLWTGDKQGLYHDCWCSTSVRFECTAPVPRYCSLGFVY